MPTLLWIILAIVVLAIVGPVVALVAFTARTARRVEAAVPRPGRMIEVDGVRLHYVEQGSGPAIVMIHGLASQMQTYTYGVAALLHGYRLIMVDRPGSGYSQPGPSASLTAQANLIDGLMARLGVERALVVGHSLGGALALALGLDHPARVAGLALLAPATHPQDAPPGPMKGLAIRSDLMRRAIGWTLAAPMSIRNRDATMTALFGPDPVPADFGTRGGGLLVLRPGTFRNASRDLVEAGGELPRFATRYRDLAMPVGILFGKGDRILDYARHGEAMRGLLPQLRLETIETGGHMVPFSHPERTAAFIETMAAASGLKAGVAAT